MGFQAHLLCEEFFNTVGMENAMPKTTLTDLERFAKYYTCDLATGCWNWHGAFDGQPRDGDNPRGRYGRFVIKKRTMGAHRASYELHCGPAPKGMQACHKCDNPACVNPDHLFLGTHQDNTDDKVAKGRCAMSRGFRPRLGTGVGLLGKVKTSCAICAAEMEQLYTGWKRGAKPCCSKACKAEMLRGLRRSGVIGQKAGNKRIPPAANAQYIRGNYMVPAVCAHCAVPTMQLMSKQRKGMESFCSNRCASLRHRRK